MVMAGKQFSLDSRMDLVSTMNKARRDGERGSDEDDVEEEKGRINSVS